MEVNSVKQIGNLCVGCGLCAVRCPQTAIEIVQDEEGFKHPKINKLKCTNCGICLKECVVHTQIKEKRDVEKVFAAFSLNKEVRYNSTSGGVFTELAKMVLNNANSVVIGAAYQSDFTVKHEIIHNINDIEKLRQSKYIQSDMHQVYKDVDELSDTTLIMFVGTPCQVSAFYRYMKERRNPVIYVDFICRGVNSPTVFQAYLKELEVKKESPISNVWFKNKEKGWNHFQTRIDFENGEIYREDRFNDAFMRGFLKHNLYMRNSCYECQFKGQQRIADITLADFWGIEFTNPEVDIENGVSAVLIHSEKGKRIFEAIKENLYYEEKDLKMVQAGNGCIDICVKKNDKRAIFYEQMNQDEFSNIIWSMEE